MQMACCLESLIFTTSLTVQCPPALDYGWMSLFADEITNLTQQLRMSAALRPMDGLTDKMSIVTDFWRLCCRWESRDSERPAGKRLQPRGRTCMVSKSVLVTLHWNIWANSLVITAGAVGRPQSERNANVKKNLSHIFRLNFFCSTNIVHHSEQRKGLLQLQLFWILW